MTSFIYAAVTRTSPTEQEKETIDSMLTQFSEVAKSGVRVRFLLPKNPDRLMMGYKYRGRGQV